MTRVPRIGLVLGAGGAVGHAFHAGVLAAIAEATGWDARRAEIIVGTSAGSGFGTFLRAGLAPADLAARAMGKPLSDEARRILGRAAVPPPQSVFEGFTPDPGTLRMAEPRHFARAALRPWSARLGTLAAAALPAGRRSTEVISNGIRALFGGGWSSEPLWICAADLEHGRRVVFGQSGGPPAALADAVAASCAIPGFFEPKVIDGVRYVDGGVYSPTNADLLAGLGLDLVVVSSPMSTVRRGLRAGVDLPARLLHHRYLAAELARVRRAGGHVLSFEPDGEDQAVMGSGLQAMDFSRRPRVTREVRESVLRRLDDHRLAARRRILEGQD
jgi:NTE family protein